MNSQPAVRAAFALAVAVFAAVDASACAMKRRHLPIAWSQLSSLQQEKFAAFRDAQHRADWDALPEDVRAVYFTVTRTLESTPGNLLTKVRRVTDVRGAQWTYDDAWPSGEPGLDCVSEPRHETRGHHFEVDVIWEPDTYASLNASADGSAFVKRHDSFLHSEETGAGEAGIDHAAGLHVLFAKRPPAGADGVNGHIHVDYRGISKMAGVMTLGNEIVRGKIKDLFGADLTGRASAPPPPGQDLRDPSQTSVDPAMWTNQRLLREGNKGPRAEPADYEGHLRESGADPLAVGPAVEEVVIGAPPRPIDNLKRFKDWYGNDGVIDAAIAAGRAGSAR